jgi:hypothetical protein
MRRPTSFFKKYKTWLILGLLVAMCYFFKDKIKTFISSLKK